LQFDANKRLPILTMPGVVAVVGMGNIPTPVKESEIESIQTVAESGGPLLPWPFLRQGQRVRIAGPLCGTIGEGLPQRSMAVVVDRDSVLPLFDIPQVCDALSGISIVLIGPHPDEIRSAG
jgi:hypothetical protein